MRERPIGASRGGTYLMGVNVEDLTEIIDALSPGRLRDRVQRRLDRIEGRQTASRRP